MRPASQDRAPSLRPRGRDGVFEEPRLSPEEIQSFRATVYEHYRRFGRDMPWRKTRDPYRILVSEVMLQQTQVRRVLVKYEEFLRAFPTIRSLAEASPARVVDAWLGLGYNRRALALHRLARIVVARGGEIPREPEELQALPGVGPATAGAVAAYAFDRPAVFVETNIRTVFIHHFFPSRRSVSDREILPLVAQTLDQANPREWYWALMDYGASLKSRAANPSRRSAHYRRQAPFEGSHRQLRGRILRATASGGAIPLRELASSLGVNPAYLAAAVHELADEGFLSVDRVVRLAEERPLASPSGPDSQENDARGEAARVPADSPEEAFD